MLTRSHTLTHAHTPTFTMHTCTHVIYSIIRVYTENAAFICMYFPPRIHLIFEWSVRQPPVTSNHTSFLSHYLDHLSLVSTDKLPYFEYLNKEVENVTTHTSMFLVVA
eukprot:Gregarina_sp_Pseudo_9__1742@NODE_2182_length_1111_cov_5_044776_g2010_i0_p1_GENE_NODE_2182_length_1111_cov_5_044776_g2010_i0NODE_2182_length_1111_cov_5_044776_g2010_i0_p1_ORF_typecomplete_len108_score7_87_NODE_2182_length_1111_cov_5_044776_g2010_i0490813